MSSVCVNSIKRKRDIRLKRACWSPTLTLKDLLMLLLFSLRLVVCCPRLCVFNVWFPEVPPVLQPGIHGLKSSDTDPVWLSSEQSSLVVEWQKIRDLNSVTITKSVSRLDYFRQTETMIIKTHSMHPTFDLCLHCKTKSNNLSTVDINLATIGFSVDRTMKSGRDACSPATKTKQTSSHQHLIQKLISYKVMCSVCVWSVYPFSIQTKVFFPPIQYFRSKVFRKI